MYSAKVLKKMITVILSLNVLKRLLAIMRLNLSTKSAQMAPLEPVGYLTEIYHQKIGQKTDLNTSWCTIVHEVRTIIINPRVPPHPQ